MTNIITESKEKQYYVGCGQSGVYIEPYIRATATHHFSFKNLQEAIAFIIANNKEDVTEFCGLLEHPAFRQYKLDWIGNNCPYPDDAEDEDEAVNKIMQDDDLRERIFKIWITEMLESQK